MVVFGTVFPAPKPITFERATSVMGFGAVKIVGAYPIYWRASTHPTLASVFEICRLSVYNLILAENMAKISCSAANICHGN